MRRLIVFIPHSLPSVDSSRFLRYSHHDKRCLTADSSEQNMTPLFVRFLLMVMLAVPLSAELVAAADVVKVGTFNCEWLNRRRIYVKYGLPLKLTPQDDAIWNLREFRDTKFKEAARAVAAAIREIDVT